jgi:hypothetical protein
VKLECESALAQCYLEYESCCVCLIHLLAVCLCTCICMFYCEGPLAFTPPSPSSADPGHDQSCGIQNVAEAFDHRGQGDVAGYICMYVCVYTCTYLFIHTLTHAHTLSLTHKHTQKDRRWLMTKFVRNFPVVDRWNERLQMVCVHVCVCVCVCV